MTPRALGEWTFATILLAVVSFLALESSRLHVNESGVGPGRWPQIVCIGMVVLILLYFVELVLRARGRIETADHPEWLEDADDDVAPQATKRNVARLLALSATQFAYVVAFPVLGFVIATTLMMYASMRLLGRPHRVRAIVESCLIVVLLYATFSVGLGVRFPGFSPF